MASVAVDPYSACPTLELSTMALLLLLPLQVLDDRFDHEVVDRAVLLLAELP